MYVGITEVAIISILVTYLMIGIITVTECYERDLCDVKHKIYEKPIRIIIMVLSWPIIRLGM